MESRAAVFTSQPHGVEVYHGGSWMAGSMLGWRHDTAGDCRVSVRLHAGGHEPIWTSLERLRLPGRPLTVAPASADGTGVDLDVARRTRPARGPSSTGPVARAM